MTIAQYRELISGDATKSKAGPKKTKSPVTKKRASPEEDLHRACFELVALLTNQFPILHYLVHVPNGGVRSKGEAGKLKAMGTRPGVPDFLLPRARGPWRGVAIELKSAKGTLSAEQKFWLKGLEEEGYLVSTCRSVDAFQQLINAYLHGLDKPACVVGDWETAIH